MINDPEVIIEVCVIKSNYKEIPCLMNDFPCWQFTYLFIFHAAWENYSDVSSPSADEFRCKFY